MAYQESFVFPSGSGSPLEKVTSLISALQTQEYYTYERRGNWHVGIGSRASLTIDPNGQKASISTERGTESLEITCSIADIARSFVRDHSEGGKVFGFVGFNYAAQTRGLDYQPGHWPLLSLMVPQVIVTVQPGSFTITGDEVEDARHIVSLLRDGQSTLVSPQMPKWHMEEDPGTYMRAVEDGLSQIRDGRLAKVILSRAVQLPGPVDMCKTLLIGRKSNTPRTTFSLRQSGFQATGFSPELVMSLENGRVTTEPLAGTRSCGASDTERQALRKDLISDPKEIVEHVLSVKAAVEELKQICSDETVVVEDFMSIRERGNVQHLGSRVCGDLSGGKDAWDAFNMLFPSITASGIPKQAALEVISSIERRPRELYSGSVLMLEGSTFFEAALVLRSVFQDERSAWLQAGAGIIDQSDPKREFTETAEKLSTIAPFVVASDTII